MSMPTDPQQPPGSPGPSRPPGPAPRDPAPAVAVLARSLGIMAAGIVLGLAGGLVWLAIAPRAAYVVTGHGYAAAINAETTAFIAADIAYCLIGLVGGLIIGMAGYLAGVRRHGPWPMAAVLAASAAAGIIARWIGERSGLAAFNGKLLHSPVGTHVLAPLGLAGDTSAAAWPTRASLPDVAFWPLGACAVAGGLTLLAVLRARSAEQARYAASLAGPQPYGS